MPVQTPVALNSHVLYIVLPLCYSHYFIIGGVQGNVGLPINVELEYMFSQDLC